VQTENYNVHKQQVGDNVIAAAYYKKQSLDNLNFLSYFGDHFAISFKCRWHCAFLWVWHQKTHVKLLSLKI